MEHLFAVIMAGGSGTRFWPESRADLPKQLLRLAGPRTMLQATVERLGDLVPLDRCIIATTERLASKVCEQLSALPRDSVIIEPCKRDTAPCIGLAAVRLQRIDPEAIMAVMPSDHVIEPPEKFQQALRLAVDLIAEDSTRLVTFGIKPTYPAETFGYIERDQPLNSPAVSAQEVPVFTVKKFHEKPNAETAQKYLEAGRFYWNSGIFVWKAKRILELLQQFQPEMYEHLQRIAAAADSEDFLQVLQREFEAIKPISIDYAVMEHAPGVVVIEAPFRWDDVGSWRALERLRPKDEAENVVEAEKALVLDSKGCIIRCSEPNHVVVTQGVEDLIIIVTKDATLVANKRKEESLRKIVKLVEEKGWTEHL